ncbi:hypothetical protein [Shumkonia mesophila]|uniref:hypothetical protein n=1 Tax=Shumkonia mesophila TaxID=2838854 RepID=UPI0029350C3D|nr:hypothetical protein [Shumkonia mesophila]
MTEIMDKQTAATIDKALGAVADLKTEAKREKVPVQEEEVALVDLTDEQVVNGGAHITKQTGRAVRLERCGGPCPPCR